jgi:hypothetical protein
MDHMRIEYHVMKLEKGGERSNAFCTAVVGSELANTRSVTTHDRTQTI